MAHSKQQPKGGSKTQPNNSGLTRKPLNPELRKHRFFNKLHAFSPAMVYVFDIGSKLNLYSSKALGDFLGYSREDVFAMGEQVFNYIIHPEDLPIYIDQLSKVIEAGGSQTLKTEVRVRLKSGGFVWVCLEEKVLNKGEAGEPLTIIGSAIDISEQKSLQSKLEHSIMELENIAFLSTHDLKEPINSINNFAQLLKIRYGNSLEEDAVVFLDFITDSTIRMRELVDSMLDYSRIGNQKESVAIDCNKLLIQVLHDLSSELDKSNARVIKEELPVIKGHTVELRRLFQNLISNAVKFRKKDKAVIVNIWAEKREEAWVFAIQDNGIGIDMKFKDKVFNLFQRLHSISKYRGSGIGLAQCKKIVELHHGEIWFQSTSDEGSTFYFSIPISRNEA